MTQPVSALTKLLAADTKRRKRNKVIRSVVVVVLTRLLLNLEGGWLLMLAVGVAHREWIPALPTIGYWWAVVLVVLLGGVIPSRSKASK